MLKYFGHNVIKQDKSQRSQGNIINKDIFMPDRTIAVILAAGKGTRMKSELPKVLHPILGKPMVSYVIDACRKAKVDNILLVIGHKADLVKETLGSDYQYVEQKEQLGTGHALMTAAETLTSIKGNVLVLAGDTPFLTGKILHQLIVRHQETKAAVSLMTTNINPPPPYGRILRDQNGRVLRIVEDRDATSAEKKITEVNTSHYCFRSEKVFPMLSNLSTENDQGEYYLTDIIHLLSQKNEIIETLSVKDPSILIGINNRYELSKTSMAMNKVILKDWMLKGVTIIDPESVYIEPDVRVGKDTVIYPFTLLMGKTSIGSNCTIGPQVKIANTVIKDRCRIEYSVIENRTIAKESTIGPFASLLKLDK
jgi:bifunctional UDP-N-acetylglucosamine pyrophosphorylase/glucosamine-1-phosphate N-acetyltransferase